MGEAPLSFAQRAAFRDKRSFQRLELAVEQEVRQFDQLDHNIGDNDRIEILNSLRNSRLAGGSDPAAGEY
jgi:hypothetical protein